VALSQALGVAFGKAELANALRCLLARQPGLAPVVCAIPLHDVVSCARRLSYETGMTCIWCTDAAACTGASMDASGSLPQLVRLMRRGDFFRSSLALALVLLGE